MYFHEKSGLIYLAHPRTGSTATAKLLTSLGFELIGSHHSGLEENYTGDWVDSVFSVVRNHYDVIASWHAATLPADRQHVEPMNHADLERVYYRAYQHMGPGPHTMYRHWFVSDDVLRYEALEEELHELLVTNGLKPEPLPRLNENKRRENMSYRQLVPKKIADRIYERFGEEIDRLGYEY